MKKLLFVIFVFISVGRLSAQAPDIDYYSQFGFSLGYGYEKFQDKIQHNALAVGVVHGSVIYKAFFYEGSALTLGLYKNDAGKLGSIGFEALVLDIGAGYSNENLMIGVAPLSVNLTESSSLGMAVHTKVKVFKHFVVENKFMPLIYGDSVDEGFFNNNFFVGIHYWNSDDFSVGVRYNRYGDTANYLVMLSWNFL